MGNLDALARVVLRYIAERDGQTILNKNIIRDTGIHHTTLKNKIKMLVEKGYIRKEGKTYFVIGKE